MRVAAVWFPDWPIQAAGGQGPMVIGAITRWRCAIGGRAGRVFGAGCACARQALCPEAAVVEANPDRDGAAFAEVAAGLDVVASSVEVLRPGLAIVDAGAALRYHGESTRDACRRLFVRRLRLHPRRRR